MLIESDELHALMKNIKTQLRLSMNGVASASMREKGLEYKVIFGVEIPRLQMIAAEFTKNHDLAQALWKEDIRECKILAMMLQPVETFYPEIADIWVESMQFPELAQMASLYLFQYLPYAPSKALEWIASDDRMKRFCGFSLYSRLWKKYNDWKPAAGEEFLDQAVTALEENDRLIRGAAAKAWNSYIDRNRATAKKSQEILKTIPVDKDEDLKARVQLLQEAAAFMLE